MRTWLTNFTFTFMHLQKEMATHSSVLAWRIPGMGKPWWAASMGSHKVGHDWSDLAAAAAGDRRSHEKSPVIFSLFPNSLWIYKLSLRETSGLPEVCSFLFTNFTCVALEILAPNRQNSSLAELTLERPKYGSPWSQELLYVCFFLPERSLFLLKNIQKIENSIITIIM